MTVTPVHSPVPWSLSVLYSSTASVFSCHWQLPWRPGPLYCTTAVLQFSSNTWLLPPHLDTTSRSRNTRARFVFRRVSRPSCFQLYCTLGCPQLQGSDHASDSVRAQGPGRTGHRRRQGVLYMYSGRGTTLAPRHGRRWRMYKTLCTVPGLCHWYSIATAVLPCSTTVHY